MPNQFNFTKSSILKLEVPEKGRVVHQDTQEKGLSIYITSNGTVTFFIRRRINHKDEKVIIGRFPDVSVEQARKKAMETKAQIAQGINPNQERRAIKQDVSFGAFFEEWIEKYCKAQKITWQQDVKEINRLCGHWLGRKLLSIQQREVQQLHEEIGKNNGTYQANRVLAKISAMYNKAIEWGWKGTNPTTGVKKFKEHSRERFVQYDEFTRLFEAIREESNGSARDYIMVSLFTGARRGNVLTMQWDELDLERGMWHVKKTKNGDSIIIPLLDEALNILRERRKNSESKWVFHSPIDESKHLVNPRKAWMRILTKAGIKDLRLHDLRRTMGSYQAMAGSSLHIIGKSLGHKTTQAEKDLRKVIFIYAPPVSKKKIAKRHGKMCRQVYPNMLTKGRVCY